VVDVRDSDRIGGHIKSSRHVPTSTLSNTVSELVHTLKDVEKVVFHCVHSTERGPSAATKYIRERQRLMGEDSIAKETWKDSGDAKDRDETGAVKKQEVYVLEGGFGKWQQEYVHNPIPPPPPAPLGRSCNMAVANGMPRATTRG